MTKKPVALIILDGFGLRDETAGNAVKAANYGWSDVQYVCIKYPGSDHIYPYMVLYVNDRPERWIPVDGNSDGCNLQVIGENLW